MRKILSIITGWWNYAFKRAKIEYMASSRAEKCKICPHLKGGIYGIFVDKEFPELSGKHCGVCGCEISAKIRSIYEGCADSPPRW